MPNQYIVNEGKLKKINIDMLKPSPYNSFDVDDIEDLEGSLLSCGLLTPLSVIGPDKNKEYQILAGERRYHAMLNINKSGRGEFIDIPCYVVGTIKMNETEQRLVIESSNLETRDFNKDEHRFQIIRLLKNMADAGDIKHKNIIKEAGKYMSMSDRYRRMYLQIFENGNDSLRLLVEQKQITVTDASSISYFDEDIQQKIVDDIKSGTKPKEAIGKYSNEKRSRAKTQREKKAEKQKLEKVAENTVTDTDVDTDMDTDAYTDVDDDNVNQQISGMEDTAEEEKEEEPVVNEDDIINAIINGEDINPEALSKAFDKYKPNIDLTCDTTGTIKKLKKLEVVEHSDDEEESSVNFVIKWCNRMMKKESFSNEEYEALDSIKELLEYMDTIEESI